MSASSRRRPWPSDADLAGLGVMLREREQGGQLTAKKIEPLSGVQPADYSYTSLPPYAERQYPYRYLTQGLGQRVQRGATDHGYRDCRYVDCSIGGRPQKALEFTTTTLPNAPDGSAPGNVVAFGYLPSAGTEVLFAAAGDDVYIGPVWTHFYHLNDACAVHATTRAVTSVVRFTDADGLDAVYFAMSTGELVRYTEHPPSASASPSASPSPSPSSSISLSPSTSPSLSPSASPSLSPSPSASPSEGTEGYWRELTQFWTAIAAAERQAMYLAVVGDELWRAWDHKISKVQADPGGNGADWAGAITVGGAAEAITSLAVYQQALYICKAKGVYSLSRTDPLTVTVTNLFPDWQFSTGTPGRNATVFGNSLYLPLDDNLYKLSTSGGTADLAPSGLTALYDNDSDVQGYVQATAAHKTWFLYYTVYNATLNTTYLMKLGSWVNPDEADPAAYQFAEVSHGALCTWASRQAQCLYVDGTLSYLFVGFGSGGVASARLPVNTPDPRSDPLCRFVTTTGTLRWPRHTGLLEADSKAYYAWSAFGTYSADPNIRTNWLVLKYRTDESESYVTLPDEIRTSGQRVELPTGLSGKLLDVEIELHNSANTATPVVDGQVLFEALQPATRLTLDLVVRAESYLARHDGSVSRRSAEQIRQHVRDLVASPGAVELRLPDQAIADASITSYAEVLHNASKRSGLAWDLALTLTQWRLEETS